MKPIYNLHDWTIESFPEGYWLIGFRYFNAFPNSKINYLKDLIHTSKLLSIDFLTMRAETKNSIYILDPIDRLYTKTYLKNVTDIATGGTHEAKIIDDAPDYEVEECTSINHIGCKCDKIPGE